MWLSDSNRGIITVHKILEDIRTKDKERLFRVGEDGTMRGKGMKLSKGKYKLNLRTLRSVRLCNLYIILGAFYIICSHVIPVYHPLFSV